MKRKVLNAVFLAAGLALLTAPALPQSPQGKPEPSVEGNRGPRPDRQGMAFGTIQSVGVNQFVAQKPDGSTVTVKVDSETQFIDSQTQLMEKKPIQLEDLKVGDHVVVRPRNPDNAGASGSPSRDGSGQQRG
jgi:hypothetical protein